MKLKLTIAAAISSVMMVSAAAAATLSIVGGTTHELGSVGPAHNPDYSGLPAFMVPAIGAGDDVTAFGDGGTFEAFDGTNGLALSGGSMVKITFLGKEAAAKNAAIGVGGMTLLNTDAAGSSIQGKDFPSWIDLIFKTQKGGVDTTIENNAGIVGPLPVSMAFYLEDSENALAFFGDGRGDSDFDDMVIRISIIPLPAGGLLLLTAIGGFAAVRRKKTA